jgi:hypothetical protein
MPNIGKVLVVPGRVEQHPDAVIDSASLHPERAHVERGGRGGRADTAGSLRPDRHLSSVERLELIVASVIDEHAVSWLERQALVREALAEHHLRGGGAEADQRGVRLLAPARLVRRRGQ